MRNRIKAECRKFLPSNEKLLGGFFLSKKCNHRLGIFDMENSPRKPTGEKVK